MENKIKLPLLLSVIIVAFVLAWAFLISPSLVPIKPVLPYAAVLESRGPTRAQEPAKNNFDAISLEAKSAYIFDLSTKKTLFSLNADVQLPLASLSKLIVALIAEESLPKDAVVQISKEAVGQDGDEGLILGELWSAPDLTDFMLISSSNDAAFALAEKISAADQKNFIALMNRRALEIGMNQTYFLNVAGLDISKNISGAYGSSRDIVRLVEHIFLNYPSLLDATSVQEISLFSFGDRPLRVGNTNKIVSLIPGLIASKTGFTDLAGGNLMIVFDVGFNHPVVSVVLGSSFDGRFGDTIKIIGAVFKYYAGGSPRPETWD